MDEPDDAGRSSPTGPAAVKAWRNTVLVAFALGGITLATWGPRLAGLRDDLGLGDAGIGLVLSGVTVGSIAGLLASTPLLTRLGGRGVMRLTLLAVAVGLMTVGLGAGVVRSVPVALLGFAIIGFGVGGLDVAINVEGSKVERAAGRTLMPLMHGAWSAGAVLGAVVGAVSTALGVAYAWQFGAEAALIALVALVGLGGIAPGGVSADDAEQAPLRERLRGWLRSWADGRLLLIGLVMLGVELGEGTANNWLTLAVHDGHGFRESVATWFFVAFAVGETLARITGGPAVDRLGRVLTVRLTTALGVIGLLLFILGTTTPLVLIGTLLWAIGVSMGFPLGMSSAADSGPGPAARVSVVATIGYVANLGGPPLIGILSQRLGLLNALFAVVVLLAAGFVFAGALRTRRPETT